MKRPSFQFYPNDWRNNIKLGRCSRGARGAWIDILCVLHDAEEYGVARFPLADLARSAGVPLKLARELASKGVLKGGDNGCPAFFYAPFHAGQHGEPVMLLCESAEALWYSSRFVKDEWIRHKRGEKTQYSVDNQPNKPSPKPSPTRDIGAYLGDGPSSSSSSSSSDSPSTLESLVSTFDEFFAIMPKQTGRRDALEAWQIAITKTDPVVLIAAARHFSASSRETEPRFITAPAKWLERERWTDVPLINGRQTAFTSQEEIEAQQRLKEKYHGEAN